MPDDYSITDEDLHYLINCQKKIFKAAHKVPIVENRSLRNEYSMRSIDGSLEFQLFTRVSTIFNEDFSVGLRLIAAPAKYDIHSTWILLRCQGPHDGKEPFGTDIHHSYHTHLLSLEDISKRRILSPSDRKETKEFSSFESALLYMARIGGIINLGEYLNVSELSGVQLRMDDV